MKSKLLFLATFMFIFGTIDAQNEKTQKEKDIDQSLKNIKKELENIKINIDSAKLREIAKTLEKSADEIASELENIASDVEDKADKLEEKQGKKSDSDMKKDDEEKANEGEKDTYTQKEEKKQKAKFDFKNKKPSVDRRTKTFFELTYGLNGLANNSGTALANTVYPTLNTWSWFWDAAIKWRTRVGGPSSKVGVTYGLSYLRNTYRFENNAYVENGTNGAIFKLKDNASADPKLVVGYVNIPLGIEFKVGKKGKFGVGGYGGYRVVSRQSLEYKTTTERVEELRKSAYGLNNLLYGASVKVGLKGITLTGRYNMSSLFNNDNNTYKYNTYMAGLSWGF